MKAGKILAPCLSLLMLAAASCAAPGSGSSSSSCAIASSVSSAAISSACKAVSGPVSSLPDSKVVEYQSEGSTSKEKFVLFHASSLPFATYVPEKGWTAGLMDRGALIRKENAAAVEAEFLKPGLSRKEALEEFDRAVKTCSGSGAAEFEEQKKPGWAVSSLYLWKKNGSGDGGTMTWAVLGLHGNRYFCLCTHCSDDAEGDYPLLKAVFREWRWKDTGEPLGYSV